MGEVIYKDFGKGLYISSPNSAGFNPAQLFSLVLRFHIWFDAVLMFLMVPFLPISVVDVTPVIKKQECNVLQYLGTHSIPLRKYLTIQTCKD